MLKNEIKIVFMGTPDFAVPALSTLKKNGYEVALVVTQPDRPKGRGRKPVSPPVKKTAIKFGYDVIQPESVKTDEFYDKISSIHPDLFVVAAFGQILPEKILSLPKIGAVNIHASLLPKYRGAAPIQWAIINREEKTGITTMFMDKKLDAGDILQTAEIKIAPDDTSDTLGSRLAQLGADLLIETIKKITSGKIKPIPQDHTLATYAPLLKKKDGQIDWKMPAKNIEAFIRGVTPWPGAFTFHNNKRLKIFKAVPVPAYPDAKPGMVIKGFPDELRVATGKGSLSILEIQSPSGKRLLIKDFLHGYNVCPGAVFS